MPFRSQAQRGFMYANHPKMAKEFEEATPKGKELPEHVKKMAEGGDTTPSGYPEPQAVDQQGLETPPEVLQALALLIGGGGFKSLTNPLKDLGESGEIGLGGRLTRFSKGVMGKGTPNETTIWGVKGDPEDIAKLGYGSDPASIPSHILDAHGIPEYVESQQPSLEANELRSLWSDMAKEQSGTPLPIRGHYERPDLLQKPTNFANGGEVKPMEKRGMKEEAGKYAFGGETNPKHETLSAMENNPTAGFADGGDVQYPAGGYSGAGTDNMQALLQMIKTGGLGSLLPGSSQTNQLAEGIAQGVTAPGSAGIVNNALGTNVQDSSQPNPNVDQSFIDQMNNAPNGGMAQTPSFTVKPTTPSIGDMTQKMQQTPPTDYNFYKDISAEDRAKLYQQLTANQKSPGSMIASGVGGLGDAIARSFGGQNTNYQQGIMANQEAQKQGALGAMDTQRQQRMQDVQAKMAMQESDPASPYSQGLRQFLGQMTGKPVPSGMSAGMIKGLFPDYVKVFEAKTQAATAAGAQGVDAGKALMGETLWDKFKESIGMGAPASGEAYLESRIGGATPSAGQSLKTPSGISYKVR